MMISLFVTLFSICTLARTVNAEELDETKWEDYEDYLVKEEEHEERVYNILLKNLPYSHLEMEICQRLLQES